MAEREVSDADHGETSGWPGHFSLDPDRVWLNASHQGPLPDVAADAAAQAITWKQRPHHLSTPEPFTSVPEGLRTSLADLIGTGPERARRVHVACSHPLAFRRRVC